VIFPSLSANYFLDLTIEILPFPTLLGRSKGFCFVEFSDQASAIAALDMNAFEIGARKVVMSITVTLLCCSILY
jgi:RNA recognition motif-containing protein